MAELRPINLPGAWRSADFRDAGDIAFALEDRHLRALERGLAHAGATGKTTESLTREDFPLDDIASDLAALRDRVRNGEGVVLLRGLPVDRYARDDLCRLFWGLGTHFGRAVSQSLMGDRLGHVTDVSRDHPGERGYRYHWRGEEAEGDEPITTYRVPVFSFCDGVLSCVFLRAFIDMAAEDRDDGITERRGAGTIFVHEKS